MNLWAESDNPELASTHLEQPRKPGTSVGTRFIASSHAAANTNATTILPTLRAWLLADYVAPYCRSLAATRIFRRCFWIDALGSTRATSKKSGESQQHDEGRENGRMGRSGSESGRGGGRDESRPYIFDDVAGMEQSNHSPARAGKAPKKAHSETLPPALQIVAALSGELARESKPITLQGIALDTTRSVGTRFIASASPEDTFVLPKESSVINASWREVAPTLFPAVEQVAAIFLVNPLAITRSGESHRSRASQQKTEGRPQGSMASHQLREGRPQGSPPLTTSTPAPTMNGGGPFLMADELAQLVQRTAPTELCLVLMHRQVEGIFLPALRSASGAAAFTALLRSDRWKAVLAKEGENGSRVERAIDLWRACLQPHFSFVQRVAFPLLIGPATVEDAPCSLLFATRRQDSLVCMNDAVRNYRRRLEVESRQGILNEAWFAAQQAERDAQALQQLSEDMLREGRARLPRRWPDLRQQFLLERFGQWTLREYDEMICRLLLADEVRCAWRQANSADLTGPRAWQRGYFAVAMEKEALLGGNARYGDARTF